MFPEYAPEIHAGDDRLAAISERMRQCLVSTNGIKPEQIEFEAKIGSIKLK